MIALYIILALIVIFIAILQQGHAAFKCGFNAGSEITSLQKSGICYQIYTVIYFQLHFLHLTASVPGPNAARSILS